MMAIVAEKHPKRPRDPNQLAKHIVDIATGEIKDLEPTAEEQGRIQQQRHWDERAARRAQDYKR
jgi:hypothetical protein